MSNSLLNLIPERYLHDQLWRTIGRRNRWLIKLRFGAFGLLFVFSLSLYLLKQISGDFTFQSSPIIIISLIILVYNILFLRIAAVLDERNKKTAKIKEYQKQYKFHELHFSLLQIITDFIFLFFFIHFTGGVETPLFIFFIFHVIIGSLILPGPVIYLIVTITYLVAVSIAYFEYSGIIPHYTLNLFPFETYNNPLYLFIYFITFGIGLYLSTYLANSIAKELYIRENRLANTLQELSEAEKNKSRYVMTVVHDLKTPIAAALTYINMILEGAIGEINSAVKRPLERSKIRLTNAVNTINDILHISQLKAETNIEDVEPVSLVDIFNEIYVDMKVLIISKELSFNLVFDNENSYIIHAEPKLLKLALANLISNAVKYTERNGTIRLELSEQKDNVKILVIDNGIGVPEKDKEKIFTTFFRTSLSKSKGIEGTGLGLSFVKEVIERYNGVITFVSPSSIKTEGRPGTQFEILLPKIYSAV